MTDIRDAIFEIKDLSCSYDGGKTVVLQVPQLDICSGQVMMLLGSSGSGKSTLLETLGLMNDTIVQGDSRIHFYKGRERTRVDLQGIWQEGGRAGIADLRREHFSFIFQETNLMENFTAWENVVLAQLIEGTDLDAAQARARTILEKVGLGELEEWRMPMDLSGGQRQRLAFVRAITSDFTVLFCDEPTGNLDVANAEELMRLVRATVREARRACVVVTHDIRLAMKFGDEIMVLRKSDARSPAVIDNNDRYRAEHLKDSVHWSAVSSGDWVPDLELKLRSLFTPESKLHAHQS
jgi:ABC-type lipoprotein export system ATPase subunit